MTATKKSHPTILKEFVESSNIVTQEEELFQLLYWSRLQGAQVESALNQKLKALTDEEIFEILLNLSFVTLTLKVVDYFRSLTSFFLCEQVYKDLSVALVYEKKSGFLHTLSTILSEEQSKLKTKLLNPELKVLPVDLLAKELFLDKVYSTAKPDSQQTMKVSAAKWRILSGKVSELAVKTTATKLWLGIHMELAKLYQDVKKRNYPSLNDSILQEDLQNFCPPDNTTYSDIAEVLEDPTEDNHEGLSDDNEDGSETSMPGFYNGIEDEYFLDNFSES
ncbi:hypothetical protein L873DRAFT_1849420 [Choiromyces venosus 120613-1]|uniref:Uncharacterized protein n=1 Tax=Choiromyces venosus 120613-1 TaxID=1336337 RepID=A0A3N4IS08_9PEZI|nr:hypothetical protein L873DRAFT_1849552 [Choiromyces venosus 120613-1]RPA89209.1 hypothetical protein L873DRAFT_1849420 [Choiromyces venosus 120613-1]